METVVGILIGIALSAACGFRVFVPLLALGIAGRVGHVPLSGDFHWIASTPALIALATATVVEIVAYYVPWLDHALDTIATPAAVLAGVMATAAVVGNLPPVLRWGLAIIAGGGAAGTVQGATVLARLKSGTLTAGLANPVVATAELTGSVITSILAILAPLLAVALIVVLLWWVYRTTRKIFFGRGTLNATVPPKTKYWTIVSNASSLGVQLTHAGASAARLARSRAMPQGTLRKSRNRMIAGVCGGLAEWFGWPAGRTRFAYVLLSILSAAFPGILVYIILWIAMPGPEGG